MGCCTPRIAYSTNLFEALRPNTTAIALDQDVVSSVVVLHKRLAAPLRWDGWAQYSLANTPLKAAQPPLAIARISHAGLLFGRDMVR
jgi:hypothetical protein